MGNLGWQELVIILAIVLVLFGPRRLPEIAEALGKSVRKFRSASHDVEREIRCDAGAPRPQDPDGR